MSAFDIPVLAFGKYDGTGRTGTRFESRSLIPVVWYLQTPFTPKGVFFPFAILFSNCLSVIFSLALYQYSSKTNQAERDGYVLMCVMFLASAKT